MKLSLDKLMTKVDNKYSLVIATSKRAREIMAGAEPTIDIGVHKPVVVALKEIEQGTVICSNLYNSPCIEVEEITETEN